MTPLAYAPIIVGEQEATAAPDGYISFTFEEASTVDFRTGLDALDIVAVNGRSLDTLPRDAKSLTNHNPLYIEVRSKITPGRVCQFIQDGELRVRFPYTQRAEQILHVPAGPLNSLLPLSGLASPATTFDPTLPSQEDGSTSFTVDAKALLSVNQEELPRWSILGSQSPQSTRLPMCDEQSFLEACTTYPITGLERIFQHTARTAAATFREVVKARRDGTISLTGRNRKPIQIVRAAPQLARVREILRTIPRTGFQCPTTPTGCSRFTFPKKELSEKLDNLFHGKWPKQTRKALKRVYQLAPASRQELQRLLSEYPDSMTVCRF